MDTGVDHAVRSIGNFHLAGAAKPEFLAELRADSILMNMERLEISKKDIQPAELTPGTEKNLKLFLFCLILFFAFTTLYVIPLSYTSLGFWAVICVAVLLGFAVL